MDWKKHRHEFKQIHDCWMLKTITRSDALDALRQLGITQARATQLLCLWRDERRIIAFTKV